MALVMGANGTMGVGGNLGGDGSMGLAVAGMGMLSCGCRNGVKLSW